jgi:hypothetical protein
MKIGWGCLYSREVYASGVDHAQNCGAVHCGNSLIPVYAIIPEGERPTTNEPAGETVVQDVLGNNCDGYEWCFRRADSKGARADPTREGATAVLWAVEGRRP